MVLVAVLSARSMTEPSAARRRGELSFAGQTVVEYQARQSHAVGATQILILVDDVSPVLTTTVDRLAADGVHATLIRDQPTLGRMIGTGDMVLLIGDGHIVPTAIIAPLIRGEGGHVLVLPSGAPTRAFERIDADHMWAGVVTAPAPILLGLLDMLGDWDLPLTFLRQVVQEGAGRTICDLTDVFDGRIVIVTDAATADAAAQALTRTRDRGTRGEGDLDDWPVGRPASVLVPLIIRHEIAPAVVRNMAIGIGLLAIVAIVGGVTTLGFILAFASLLADRVAAQLDRLLRLLPHKRPVDRAVPVLVLIVLLVGGLLHGGDGPLSGAGAMAFVGLLALRGVLQRKGIGEDVPEILKFAPGCALLLLAFGSLIGALPTAFAIGALLAFASHANLILRG
jgi:hypothetical protein